MALSRTLQIESVFAWPQLLRALERLHRVERLARLRDRHHELARIRDRVAVAVLVAELHVARDLREALDPVARHRARVEARARGEDQHASRCPRKPATRRRRRGRPRRRRRRSRLRACRRPRAAARGSPSACSGGRGRGRPRRRESSDRCTSRFTSRPSLSTTRTPPRFERHHVAVLEVDHACASRRSAAETSEARKFSPSPRPTTSGQPMRAPVIVSGSASATTPRA